jgi:hypothetical protein
MATFLVEDFGDVLAELATGTYDIHPGVAPVDVGAGRLRPGTPAPVVEDELCSVQPLQGDDVQRLPEGERVEAWRTVFTRYPLKGPDTRTGRTADVIIIDDVPFAVDKAHPWSGAAGVTQALVRKAER